MKEINVTVIGSGSTYCPELIYGFIEAKDSLKLKRVAFMDIDERKREIVGSLCVRMLKSAGIDCEVVMTDDLDLALQGADSFFKQILVHGFYHADPHPGNIFVVENGALSYEEAAEGYVIREEQVVQGNQYKNGMVQILLTHQEDFHVLFLWLCLTILIPANPLPLCRPISSVRFVQAVCPELR